MLKLSPFYTAEAQQDSAHFPACVSEGLCRAASPEGQAAWLALGSPRGHRDSGEVKLPTTDVETKPEHCHQTRQGTLCQPVPEQASHCLGVTPKFWVEIMYSRDLSVTQEQL